jgi:hypothetical protein
MLPLGALPSGAPSVVNHPLLALNMKSRTVVGSLVLSVGSPWEVGFIGSKRSLALSFPPDRPPKISDILNKRKQEKLVIDWKP